jgi:hypothetical protein
MPKPVLQAMVLADHVYQDRATGKHVICGTFTAILFSPFKAAQNEGESRVQVTAEQVQRTGSPYLYLALVGVHGTVPLALKFVDLSDARVLFEAQVVITATDPVGRRRVHNPTAHTPSKTGRKLLPRPPTRR